MKPLTVSFLFFFLTACHLGSSAFYQYGGIAGLSPTEREAIFGMGSPPLSKSVVGSSFDEQDRRLLEKTSPATLQNIQQGSSLSIQDIIRLHEAGINDEIIMQYIHHTKTSYRLSHDTIRQLQQAGSSQKLINYIIDTVR